MKQVRLTAQEQRAWSTNTPWLVNDKGTPQFPLFPALEKKVSEVAMQAKRRETSLKIEVELPDPSQETHKPKNGASPEVKLSKYEIKVVVKRVGKGDGEIKTWCYVNDLLRVSHRDIMIARFFKKHGECCLRRVNGKFLKTVRDPNRKISNVAATSGDRSQVAPRPENCQCFQWAGREKGKHHALCQFNAFAPPEEQGSHPGVNATVTKRKIQKVPPKAAASSAHAIAQEHIPEPKDCECRNWDGAEEGKHLPICQWHDKWEARKNVQTPRYLVSLSSGLIVREASLQEVADSDTQAQKNGFPLLTIGEDMFAVLTREEAASEVMEKIKEATSEEEPAPQTERGASDEVAPAPGADEAEEGEQIEFARPETTEGTEGEVIPVAPTPKENVGLARADGEEEEGLPLPGLT